MKRIPLEPGFNAWREAAREALHLGYRPEELAAMTAVLQSELARRR